MKLPKLCVMSGDKQTEGNTQVHSENHLPAKQAPLH